MKNKVIIFCFFLLFLSLFSIKAQQNLNINSVFANYGMKEESILVELSTDVLSNNTKISFYKSLVMPESTISENDCMEAIKRDLTGGAKLIESVKNGKVETGYYVLKHDPKDKEYEYILYKNKSKKITLVYLKGNFPPQKLEQELDKLKDLFIYVNKKRIKLN